MSIKDQIRAEIERQRGLHSSVPFSDNYEMGYSDGYQECCDNILASLDILSAHPASEELEKEIARYLREECSADDEPSISDIARHFAEWQKVQDQKTIELAEDHAMLAGMNKMEQQMMEGAVEHYVVGEIAGHPVGPAIVHYDESLNIGDKVKVIVIKED